MSDTTDWLAAAGGIVGAIGGPAGLWAAWNQYQVSRRRRYGPPPQLLDLISQVCDVACAAEFAYQKQEWFNRFDLASTIYRIEELTYLVEDYKLRRLLRRLAGNAELMLRSVIVETDSAEQRAIVASRQAHHAARAMRCGEDVLKALRPRLGL
ncbi:hypothetical protein RM704_12870 [Streptomyces sp. DSM 3412]|uniref:Uncharacterized protein n=1 Tax=Streptomyces gottesmaniae TaxID=3075518 RepID=A0ABU2YVL9_9ACTN|nr:hypothetical protein [Streptomyces sp. DSM 3412]MDT0568355.1 hypothetical protein [Streptomyces sp. DSM 3412]